MAACSSRMPLSAVEPTLVSARVVLATKAAILPMTAAASPLLERREAAEEVEEEEEEEEEGEEEEESLPPLPNIESCCRSSEPAPAALAC